MESRFIEGAKRQPFYYYLTIYRDNGQNDPCSPVREMLNQHNSLQKGIASIIRSFHRTVGDSSLTTKALMRMR